MLHIRVYICKTFTNELCNSLGWNKCLQWDAFGFTTPKLNQIQNQNFFENQGKNPFQGAIQWTQTCAIDTFYAQIQCNYLNRSVFGKQYSGHSSHRLRYLHLARHVSWVSVTGEKGPRRSVVYRTVGIAAMFDNQQMADHCSYHGTTANRWWLKDKSYTNKRKKKANQEAAWVSFEDQ